eukprot:TRINITY_DN3296_c0_g1_i3.p1 TRINITY_DN3296_c0_g1~~TRINITY_DN3296_c0_g1_i3.p1  ORF type:complete len:365 (-),score=40.94 TRINITY_DN3296_c0_g1_i3:153-1247(-)
MLRILFVYSRNFPEISYQQGMHELLANIIYLVDGEKLINSESDPDPLVFFLDARYVEQDSYILFSQLMKFTRDSFMIEPEIDDDQNVTCTCDVVAKCHEIQNVILKDKDPALYEHLCQVNIEPQIYALRWIRLILGREFNLEDLLVLWDAIFAYNNNLELLRFLCAALLIHLRTRLLGESTTVCLRVLFQCPRLLEVSELISQALLLASGGHLLPQVSVSSSKDPVPQKRTAHNTLAHSSRSLPVLSHPSNHKETKTQTMTTARFAKRTTPPPPPPRSNSATQLIKRTEKEANADLICHILETNALQKRMSDRLEPIIASLQQELVKSQLSNIHVSDSLLMAIANLKQIKDILAGLLPDPHCPH